MSDQVGNQNVCFLIYLPDITYVPVCHTTGRVESADILAAIKSTTIMVTVMLANNETGIIQVDVLFDMQMHSSAIL